MKRINPVPRRLTEGLIQTGLVVSFVMTILSAWTIFGAKRTPAAAAGAVAGAAQVVDGSTGQPLTSGGSKTSFSFVLPTGAACTGDSANGGYRVQSFMVLSSVDPTTLTFSSQGPTPPATGANFREPLFPPGGGSPYVNAQTAQAETTGGPGAVVNIPRFDFGVYTTPQVPAGTYLLGIACTLTGAVDKVWDVQFTFAASTSDPLGVTWTASAATTTTTTTTTTSSTSSTTSTSVTNSTTSVTSADSSTSDTSSSPTVAADTTTTASGSSLAATGSNPLPLVVWAVLLLWFGRMALLISRRTEIRSSNKP